MPSTGAARVLEPWLDGELLRLRDGVEIITGAGGRTMLVSPAGKFLNVSTSGLPLLQRLQSGATGRELVSALAADHPAREASAREVVPLFLAGLRQAAVLNVEPEPAGARSALTILSRIDVVKRFPIVRDPNRYCEPVARALAHLPARALSAVLLCVPLLALPLIALALRQPSPSSAHRPTLTLVLAVLLTMLCQILVHESCHGVAMAYNRVRAKEAGVGLLFYLLPIAYVDRTDSYRHRGRWGRVLISLVGPLSDLLWAGVSAAAVMWTSGPVATFFHLLLLLQLLSILANLNPLFPSDGYHAIEAALGSINMRGRALAFVLHRVTAKPLPVHLRTLTRPVRAGYVAYVVLSVLYTLAVLVSVAVNLVVLSVRVLP